MEPKRTPKTERKYEYISSEQIHANINVDMFSNRNAVRTLRKFKFMFEK